MRGAGQSDPGDPARHRRAGVERSRLHARLQGQHERRSTRRARRPICGGNSPRTSRPGPACRRRLAGSGKARFRTTDLPCSAESHWLQASRRDRVPAMAVTDIATRTYNHGWRLDPIVRSLLDTDFYKLLMLQMIREFYPDQQRDLFGHQPQPACAARRGHRRGRAARPARSRPHHPLQQEGADLARR